MKKKTDFISITIPVKPHIKKYISIRYGTEHTLTKKSLIGILLFNVLDKKTEKPNQNFKEYSEKYLIHISPQYFYEKGFSIPLRKRRFLAICLEKLFIEDFYAYVDISVSNMNCTAVEAMRIFFKQYSISEDEIKFYSFYRQYQRHCKNGIKAKKII
ncbi:hypothetical protein KBJ98_02015 [Flavobacterium sp. F-328]|uniref:Uncharacterized protein n=1 Tax=Flavobacterium erciyesense TaxID=2825842 RepID=A0ABS5D0D2_9FLAO|nr:hypothetical protein [Flavobacterium erciyesense]MBQ0907471.1 hypothetical protein [Flavobacterium erciyesense]